LQFVFHLAANLHQLVPMQHQLPQIALLPVRSPQPRKPPLNPQPQNVRRVPLVRLLLAHLAGSHLRRIADPDLVPQILDPLDQPLTVPRGFHTNHPLLIKHFAVTVGMYQLPFPAIPCLAIQPTYLLPAGMEITSYNHHLRRLLSSQRLCPQTKTTGLIEPSLLSNQSRPNFGERLV